MRQQYVELNLRRETLETIGLINRIITGYQQQGYKLSVRQIYYQLVARDLIENTERSYKRIASIINDGRLAGMIDWDAIEDRNRDIEMRTRWESGSSILAAASFGFHMDMWANQNNRVFVIVEKAELAGVLERVCQKWDVPLLAARGYPSVSIVREMVEEHFSKTMFGQCPVILHLGDHDPSGIDMTRDLDERIEMFSQPYIDSGSFTPTVERIALTMEQVSDQNPPPNPAKTTDARFASYQRKFGTESWELDALTPSFINDLVEGKIEENINMDKWRERQEEEVEAIRARLNDVAERFDDE